MPRSCTPSSSIGTGSEPATRWGNHPIGGGQDGAKPARRQAVRIDGSWPERYSRATNRQGGSVRGIGVDVGGTFTDLALWDDERGALAVFKLPSVPHDPALGILEGLRTLVAREG